MASIPVGKRSSSAKRRFTLLDSYRFSFAQNGKDIFMKIVFHRKIGSKRM
jgi:hypothetical protein